MVSVTLSIPEETKEKMEHFSEINWSGFIRKAIQEKAEELQWKETMKKELTKETEIDRWSLELQHNARKNRIQELKKKGLL